MTTRSSDRLLRTILGASAFVSGTIVVLILVFVGRESLDALAAVGPGFLADASWHPAPDAGDGAFLLVPMIAGTLAVTLGSVLLAAPLGLLSAVYLRWVAGYRKGRLFRRMVELLAGIPSVVYGFWGLVVIVPLIRSVEPPGASLLAGIVILTIMILPTIALTADAALGSVPAELLRGSAALGLSRSTTLTSVVIPACRSGLGTGVVLATGRALGETMAVLMVCGNVVQVPDSLFAPVRTLTANIALEMAYAMGDHRSALFVSGLLLLLLVAALVALAEAGIGAARRAHA